MGQTNNDYLVPVKVLSRVFRPRFCDELKALIKNDTLKVPQATKPVDLINTLFKKQWVVYAKKTGNIVDYALEYLARYTNRVAISNDRITSVSGDTVSFRYKDPKTGKYNRVMTLNKQEFIRRFLQHILPLGFYKIRYFGILAAANSENKKQESLALINEPQYISELEGLNAWEAFVHITESDPSLCRKCKAVRMITQRFENAG